MLSCRRCQQCIFSSQDTCEYCGHVVGVQSNNLNSINLQEPELNEEGELVVPPAALPTQQLDHKVEVKARIFPGYKNASKELDLYFVCFTAALILALITLGLALLIIIPVFVLVCLFKAPNDSVESNNVTLIFNNDKQEMTGPESLGALKRQT